tara:strand:- start:822 stop:1016 length:195 start_codon:yes stop_codon:yes gene_type:complete
MKVGDLVSMKVGDLVRDTERGDIGVIIYCCDDVTYFCNDVKETSYEVVFPTETVLLTDAHLELL